MIAIYLLAAIGLLSLLALAFLAFGVVFIGRFPEDLSEAAPVERRLAREKHP